MSFLASIPVIGKVVEKVLGIVDQAVPDGDLREKLKSEIQTNLMQLDYSAFEKEIDARAKIILAEIQGESKWQRNWRPALMWICIVIIANNFLVYPYLSLFFDKVVILELPEWLYRAMTIGVGGYVLGRSGEKMIKTFKNGGSE